MDLSEAKNWTDQVFAAEVAERIAYLLEDFGGDEVMANKIAYSYIRFSSVAQEQGDSLRRQTQGAIDYAAANGLTLDHTTYQDLGISAFRKQNTTIGKLGLFIQAIDAGVIVPGSTLIVESLDRLSRAQVDEALEQFLGIIRRGITIVTLQDGQSYSTEKIKADKGISLIISITVMMRAHEESLIKSTRIKAAWASKRKSGEILTSMGPAWLKLTKGEWKVIKDKADIVRTIFKMGAAGHGSPSIARKLNESKTPTLGGIATEWSPGLVAAVLKNKSVMGTYTPKKAKADPVDNYYPVIISPLDFYRVQEHIAGRNQRGGVKGTNVANLFAGMTYCECGRRTRFVSGSKPHLYLRCLSAYGNTGCDAPTMPYNVIEKAIIEWMDKLSASVTHFTTAVTDPTLTTRSEIAEREERLERLLDLAESGSHGIGARITKLEAELIGLREHLKNAVPVTPVTTALNIYSELAKAKKKGPAALTEHRMLLQSAIRRVMTKVVLLKAEHNRALKDEPPQMVRELIIEGPIVEPLRQWRDGEWESATVGFGDIAEENTYDSLVPAAPHMRDVGEGIVVPYEMPHQGFRLGNIRGRRRKT